MMGNSNRHEDAARAEVLEQQLREQQRLQEEERRRAEDQMDRERKDRAERRRREREMAEAEDARQDELMRKAMEENEQRKQEESARETVRIAQQEAQLERTLENGAAALDRQRDVNVAEVTRSATAHQDVIRRQEVARGAVETKASERVLDLTNQRAEAQEKLHNEREGYAERELTETREHHSRMQGLEEAKGKILVEREENAIKHKERLFVITETFKARQIELPIAGERDRREMNFADAVHNVRTSETDLRRAITGVTKLGSYIENRIPLSPKVINLCKASLERSIISLVVLTDSSAAIRSQAENKNKAVRECQSAALEIQQVLRVLQPLVESVDGFLFDGLDDQQKANFLELIRKIQIEHDKLFKIINNLPVVHRTDYVTATIVQQVEAITNGGMYVARTEQVAIGVNVAIEEKESGGVTVEEAD